MRALRLSRRQLVFAAAALAGAGLAPAAAQEVIGNAAVTGAGSSFAYPIVSQWAHGYHRWVAGGGEFPTAEGGLDDPPSGPLLDYEPSGSLAGIMRVRSRAVDFGASDMPLPVADLRKNGLVQFPLVIGGVVAVVNVEGVGPAQLRLTGDLLAEILLGRVQTWSDPAIRALNPVLRLPDAPIKVVRRSDGSGTTFNLTDFLSKVSPRWRETVGADLVVSWPTGVGARGNSGVAQLVAQTPNAIGYVEYAQAVKSRLSYALIRNRAGNFVSPGPASFQAAASSAAWDGAGDFHLVLTDAPGADAYPIVATVFVLMHTNTPSRRVRSALRFFTWALERGAADAAYLGYVPLPQALVGQVKNYWGQSFKVRL